MKSEIKLLLKDVTKLSTSRLQSTAALPLTDACVKARPYEDLPMPKGLPIIGNAHQMLSKENMKYSDRFFSGLREQFGDIFKLRLFNKDLVFICSPEASRTLYSKDGTMPFLPGFEKFQEIRSKSMSHYYPIPGLLSQGEHWRDFRRAVQQDMMRPRSALYYIEHLNHTADLLCDKLWESMDENGDTSNTNLILQKFALEASGIMFIGSHLEVLSGKGEGKRLMDAVTVLISKLQLLLNLPMWILKVKGEHKALVECMTTIYEICSEKIQEAMERDKIDGSLEGTVLGRLFDRCGKDSPIPIIMAVDALAAGIDTTAHTASFLAYHLAINPDKQEKLYEEICQVVGPNGEMTEAKLAEMRYLKACQQESQRIWPIANGTARKTQEDMILSGYHIPKDTTVIRVGILTSNDEKYYKDPEKFLPERWIRGCPHNQKVDPFANLPFGHGSRACIGQRFAKLELYMVAFRLVQRFKLEYHHDPVQVDFTGVGHPDRDVKIRLVPRN